MSDGLRAERVFKRYGARFAVRDVSLSVKPGEALLLAGHNGSGKTTLLRLLSGALQPNAGTIVVRGIVVRGAGGKEALRQHVGLLSHASGHYDDLSAEENLWVHAELLGASRSDVVRLLDAVNLSARASQPVRQFSAGMKKRLAIARLLLKAPEVVLLDEPFGELDPAGMAWMEDWILSLKQQGKAVILSTHWIEQGRRLCDRALHLREGVVEAS